MYSLKLILLYIGWALLWAMVQVLVLYQAGYAWELTVTDGLVTNGAIVLGGYVIGSCLRFYQPELKNVAYLLGSTLVLAGLGVAAAEWVLEQALNGQTAYLQFVDATLPVRFAFAWLMLLFMALLHGLWAYMREQQQAEERKLSLEKLAREAELHTLQQKLQPHFLFNSLNSISALIGARPEQARCMTQQLSEFLRGTLRKDDQQLVPLQDELQHLQLYLDIEKVRFGHRLQTVLEHQSETLTLQLPVLLLQPVVENAIKFGLYDTLGDTTIRLSARAEAGQLVLVVQNPYDPATLQPRRGTGFGLDSVRRRLYLLYARPDLLTTEQSGALFITTIKIPQSL
ncbi:sensor histidine kinase [Pontibacter qinzhouensis]|uniref:Sensor histidine kinase n=1 Tax=Pontibacter qinzhouensis TaxID=2603253 RepID=A0A5C8KAR6_9BACT|nr:histidine kinase [Pontibacter qinzhouensis]TXK47410.1 sensor histidine kinase [Pontibacter qinzhouensis]